MASQMKYNLKDARDLDAAFRLTWSGGWTYSATGATPNGTNGYANTNLVPSTALTLNSTHLSFYSRTNQAAGNVYEFGVSPDPSDLPLMLLSARFTGDLIRSSQYDYNLTQIYTANADSTGYYSNTRTSVNSHKVYKNGALLATNTVTSIQALPYTQPMYMSAGNFQGTANRFSSKQVAFATIGNGLTDQENQLLNQITEKYQVALSRGVQAARSFYYNSAYSNEANTYLYSTQITGTTQVSAINTLINGLKANNLWTKMKAVYPFVTDKWNLFSFTEDLTNVAWSKSNVSATLTGTFLGNNVYKLADTTNTNVVHLIAQGPMIVSNTYTVSVNFKKAEYDYAQIFEGGAVFNLANGTVQSSLGSNATMVDLGDGWYRCSVTVVSGAANIHIAANKTATSGYSYLSTIGYGIFMSAPQIQYGTIASPYQVISGTNSNTINQTAVAAQMKFNLVNPQDTDAAFRLAFSGGWTYSTNGAQPNGTNGYADTKLGQTAAGMFTNSHLSFYSRTNSTTATAQVEMGVGATVPGTFANLLMRLDTSTNYVGGSIGSRNALSTAANSIGHVIVNALSASAKAYKNGSLVATDTSTQTGTLNSLPIFIGCQNNNSVPGAYTTRQTAFASIGDGLSDAEAALLYSLVQQFQTDLTRQV
jgi:hypothetical protein